MKIEEKTEGDVTTLFLKGRMIDHFATMKDIQYELLDEIGIVFVTGCRCFQAYR